MGKQEIDMEFVNNLLVAMDKARSMKANAVYAKLENVLDFYLKNINNNIKDGKVTELTLLRHVDRERGNAEDQSFPRQPVLIRPPRVTSTEEATSRQRPAPPVITPAPSTLLRARPASLNDDVTGNTTLPAMTSGSMTLDEAASQIVARYNDEKVRSKFDGWNNSLVISVPDVNRSFIFKIRGSDGIEMNEGADEGAAVQVTMDSDMFVKLLSKQVNPIKAYSSGGLKVKGEMKNLLKLRKLMF